MSTVHTEDLIDAHDVAEILGLSHPNSLSPYLHRYPGMPKPGVDLGRGRPRPWVRQETGQWADKRDGARRVVELGSRCPPIQSVQFVRGIEGQLGWVWA